MTRPEPGLGETMQAVAMLGFEPVACPMLRIVRRRPLLPAPARLGAILLTSGQAVAPLARAAASDPAWFAMDVLAVGDRTAERAREAGFGRVASAQGDAHDLAALADRTLAPGAAILLASGGGQGLALAAALRAQGRIVHRRSVYAAHPVAALPAAARTALAGGAIDACLFFSAETAAGFVRVLPGTLRPALATVDALAIGGAAARLLAALPWRSVQVAAEPQAAAMLEMLHRQDHLSQKQPRMTQ